MSTKNHMNYKWTWLELVKRKKTCSINSLMMSEQMTKVNKLSKWNKFIPDKQLKTVHPLKTFLKELYQLAKAPVAQDSWKWLIILRWVQTKALTKELVLKCTINNNIIKDFLETRCKGETSHREQISKIRLQLILKFSKLIYLDFTLKNVKKSCFRTCR